MSIEIEELLKCQNVLGVYVFNEQGKFESKCNPELVPNNIMAIAQNAIQLVKAIDPQDDPRIVKLISDKYEYQIAPENDSYILVVKRIE